MVVVVIRVNPSLHKAVSGEYYIALMEAKIPNDIKNSTMALQLCFAEFGCKPQTYVHIHTYIQFCFFLFCGWLVYLFCDLYILFGPLG